MTAAQLRGMLGANTHMGWQDTQSWGVANQGNVLRAFLYSGVTLFRDGAPQDWNGLFPVYDSLFRNHGIGLCGLVARPDGRDDVPLYARLEARTPGMLRIIEGENETQRSPDASKADLKTLYTAVKADPVLRHVPVAACSTTGANSIETIGSTAGICDMGNDHPYSGTRSPGHSMSSSAARMEAANPGKAKLQGEFGWSITGTGMWSTVTDDDRARFVLIAWMAAALAGVDAAIVYALMDNGPPNSQSNEDTFGLFGQDGGAHASGRAVHNMMAILADAAPPGAAVPGLLTATVAGGAPNTLSITKGDGSHWLVLWPADDGPGGPASVTLPGPIDQCHLHDPIHGDIATTSFPPNSTTLQLTVPNYPVVIEIGKAATAAAVGPASPSGTLVTGTAGNVVDAAGHSFTLVPSPSRGLQIARDGVVDAPTSQVKVLAWIAGALYQVNVEGHGWSKAGGASGVAGEWVRVAAVPMSP